jgi:hypothetical protein
MTDANAWGVKAKVAELTGEVLRDLLPAADTGGTKEEAYSCE